MFNLGSSGATGGGTPTYGGGAKGVPFSRVVTVADTSFATITVTLPRSTKPTKIVASVSAGSANIQVQGNGQEMYAGAIAPNVPLVLDLAGYPEVTSVPVQVEQFAASTLNGSVYYP
jgi:hypothetical protein